MSQMYAEVERIVNEDISPRVNQLDVILEAITNSVHANSTEIVCYLNSNDNLLTDENEEIGAIRVDSIKVVDNGDGLNDENFKSFSTYRTKLKKDLGCKGVGRFVFLKVYKKAHFDSSIVPEQAKKSFEFNLEFDTDNVDVTKTEVEFNRTSVSFDHLTEAYYNQDRKLDRRVELDISKIREKVLINLIPTLFFYKEQGRKIKIKFIDEHAGISNEINPNDIPDLAKRVFKLTDKSNHTYNFTLHYKISDNPGELYSFYCANNRTVSEFSEKDLRISLPKGYSGFMLLESKYFDQRVNNERNDFDIFPVKIDVFSTLSWEIINDSLKNLIGDLISESIPETSSINKEKLQEIQDERPYLMNYIEDKDIDMVGFLDKNQIIEKAKKRFDTAKENVLRSSGKDDYTDEDLREAIQLAQNELVSYINDRVLIIDRLKKMVDKKEMVESIIHNLFMRQHTRQDYYSLGQNNLWLLDDRYTTYSYAASEKRIKDVLQDLDETYEDIDIANDRPDLSIFFSNNPNKSDHLKSVLVELKAFDYKSKSDRKKFAGVQQLIDYAQAFKAKEKIDEVYCYLITDVDTKLAERLTVDDFTPLFSNETPIYHRHYDKIGVSVFVVSAKTLIQDAEARNKVFLDIIKKQQRIHQLIKLN